MKNLILITVAILFCGNAKAQDYMPFNFEKGIWVNTIGSAINGNIVNDHYQYFCKGDTLIDSIKYYKLYQFQIHEPEYGLIDTFPVSFNCAIRNNDKKQVIIIFGSIPIVLYDFNLKIGDTILNGIYGYYHNPPVVKKIDSALICGKYYRRYKTQFSLGQGDTTSLIEGVGMNQCLFGLIGIDGIFESGNGGCYTENNNGSCLNCSLLLSVKKVQYLSEDITIFPNPGNSELLVSSVKNIRKILIYNSLGQQILCNYFLNSNNASVNIKPFVAGTYFIKVEFSDNSNKIKTFFKN